MSFVKRTAAALIAVAAAATVTAGFASAAPEAKSPGTNKSPQVNKQSPKGNNNDQAGKGNIQQNGDNNTVVQQTNNINVIEVVKERDTNRQKDKFRRLNQNDKAELFRVNPSLGFRFVIELGSSAGS